MTSRFTAAMSRVLAGLDLKEMDPALLSFAISHRAAELRASSDLFTDALELAAFAHRNDVRNPSKDGRGQPYIGHPFRNVLRLLRYGCVDEATLCATALHDTVEDCPAEVISLFDGPDAAAFDAAGAQSRALELIAGHFGDRTSALVAAVTNPLDTSSTEDRHRAYADHVTSVVGEPRVFLVKFVDFVDNAGSVQYVEDLTRRQRLSDKYRPLVPVFRSVLDTVEADLPVSADGLIQIRGHLDRIADRLG
ncbi:HD domain-containing protein [Rhodococcus spelaei]|uniref:HD domain-containing protein n=1 Tax=Rhodococcus spelaei TaxID=2546320 RepID=A0A541AZX3_9NOCA|nr:HD domain-containing protein [Rhodococcus spelaei]TQF65621.1 HD domain-containing protein [Rhodococcus spelaei]